MKLTQLTPSIIELLESIYASHDTVKITVQHDPAASEGGTISTYFKRLPYEAHIKGASETIYSLLNYVPNAETTKLLSSLKGKGPYTVEQRQLEMLIKSCVEACHRLITLFDPEVIVYPTSRSTLVRMFVERLHKHYPSIRFVDEAFIKKLLKTGDEEALLNTKHPEWEKFAASNPKEAEHLKRTLKRHAAGGTLELKRLYKPHLKFVKNFMELRNPSHTLDNVIGRRVLVVDDILSTGSTMVEMFRQLEEFEPEAMAGLTIFKRTTAYH